MSDDKLPDYEAEVLNQIYDEMYEYSGLDTGFIENVLDLAKTNDEMYEEAVRYFRCENTVQRKYHEEEMTKILQKNNRL